MKDQLVHYLQQAREVMVWKLDGVSEYDVRRPMVPTGTNLLGLVKHLAAMDAGYFGEVFDRPFPEELPWTEDDAEPNADMWATADESREYIIELYRRTWAHSDATIAELELDAVGYVPWWTPASQHPTLHRVLVHMIAETNRHAGHADIIRELIDGQVGHRVDVLNLDRGNDWEQHWGRLEQAARAASGRAN